MKGREGKERKREGKKEMEKRKVKAKVKVREGAERKEEGKERKTWKGIRRHGRKKKNNTKAMGGERERRKH